MEHIIGQYGLFRIITITQRLIEHRQLTIELDFYRWDRSTPYNCGIKETILER